MRSKGLTLVELLVASSTLLLLVLGACSLFLAGAKQFYSTEADVDITQANANGIRRISQQLRQAMNITINSSGTSVSYTMPAYSPYIDDITGERELLDPATSDGVSRSYTISNGRLIDDRTGKVFVKNIILTDPDPTSSQYGQTYAPFQLTTIGSRRALTINLIAQKKMSSINRYVRMKSTVIIRNGS